MSRLLKSTATFAACASLCASVGAIAADTDYAARIRGVLAATPLIDGHNDLAWEIRERFHADPDSIDLSLDTAHLPHEPDAPALMTDIPRLRAGQVGGQFWSVYIPPRSPERGRWR